MSQTPPPSLPWAPLWIMNDFPTVCYASYLSSVTRKTYCALRFYKEWHILSPLTSFLCLTTTDTCDWSAKSRSFSFTFSCIFTPYFIFRGGTGPLALNVSSASQCKQCSSRLTRRALQQTRHDPHSDEQRCCTPMLFLSGTGIFILWSDAVVWKSSLEPSHPTAHTNTHEPQTVLKSIHPVIRCKQLFVDTHQGFGGGVKHNEGLQVIWTRFLWEALAPVCTLLIGL